MALTFLAQSGSWNAKLKTVSFHALDGQNGCLFSVPAEVLSDLEGTPTGDERSCLRVFEARRQEIEDVAQHIYESRDEDEPGIYRLRLEDFR